MAEDGGVLSDMTPQPAANPDAHTTVNDFLDYTEYFPSDLVRSLRLIGDLDSTYLDATHLVHDLTVKYGKLPTIPANTRPDPTALRAEIAATLDKALHCRESSYAEAVRLCEVAERHAHRIKIIKAKLKALPEPPSRDPTPVPVSPQATRPANRPFDRAPHLRLTFDGGRHGSGTSRSRAQGRSGVALPGSRIRDSSTSSSDSEVRSTIDLAVTPRKLKINKDKPQKTPRVRVRVPGSGTNVHSSIAGISTSNALAKLSPPPPDAKPGSRYAPWFKLTEYEMAVLRKKMKKNAVWVPSETMMKRQLELAHRGQEAYEREKARCEATGEELLDEEPVTSSSRSKPAAPTAAPTAIVAPTPVPEKAKSPTPVATPMATPAVNPAVNPVVNPVVNPATNPVVNPATNPVVKPIANPVVSPIVNPAVNHVEPVDIPIETPAVAVPEDSITVEPATIKSPANFQHESRRRQAERDAQELEEVTKKLHQVANTIQGLNICTLDAIVKESSRTNNSSKRKREPSPQPTASTPNLLREASVASQDNSTKPPDPKRLRILPPLAPAPPPAASLTPKTTTPVAPSPVMNTPVPLPENVRSISIQVPLAPAGPATPKALKSSGKTTSRHATPDPTSPHVPNPTEPAKSPTLSVPPITSVTAASTRSRRESVAPKAATPPPAHSQIVKAHKNVTSTAESSLPTRPRSSRGHVPTPKAQSEEPKPLELEPSLRQQSIFVPPPFTGPTRASARKKPPPKGDISAGSEGQKTVTNVKRAQGNKNKRKKKADEESEPADDIDPNEPRYCICDDVSFGQMISCDNNCEKEWYHLGCVGMTEKDIPSRRAKWYCPDCRIQLNTDAYGNPLVPPPLPGRNRGNR